MIRLGFIGSGGYGRSHIDAFLSLQQEGLVQITGLADTSPAVLAALEEVPGLAAVRHFTDYRDLLASADLDAVVISAPIPLHHEITLAALERGLFILLEKPPVPLLSQLDDLITADAGRRVMVAFQHIYSGLIQNLKKELVAGRAGKLRSISAHGIWPRDTNYYQRAGWAGQLEWRGLPVLDGPCTNACAHYINIALFLAGEDGDAFAMPVEISGEAYRARRGLPTYDTGCLSGTFDHGTRFFMGFSHAASQTSAVQIEITGEKETLTLYNDSETLRRGDNSLIKGDDGRDSMRRSFLGFAGGDATRNKTPLAAMRPYVLSTNLMLLSSGGIHDISPGYVREINPGTGNAFFEVENIAAFIGESALRAAPLCAASAPWSVASTAIAAANFNEGELVRALQMSTAANVKN